jgi:hypothetical protein
MSLDNLKLRTKSLIPLAVMALARPNSQTFNIATSG